MKAYEQFLRDAGTPIGVLGTIILAFWFLFRAASWMFSSDPNENAWTVECEQLAVGNTILVEQDKMGGQHYCMVLTPIEEYSTLTTTTSEWKTGCETLGGVHRSRNYTYTCYREVVVEELGAQESFQVDSP